MPMVVFKKGLRLRSLSNFVRVLWFVGFGVLFVQSNVAVAAWIHPHISQAVFAKSVQDRTPINIIETADNTLDKIYFFTNLRNLSGERITHRWIYKGRVKAEVSFDIKGKRWRVWSSKKLWHRWLGQWRVEVVNGAGEVLFSKTFILTARNDSPTDTQDFENP